MWIFRRTRVHVDPDVLSEYLDDRLPTIDRQKVERHLGVCSSCRAELESLESTVRLLKRVPLVSPRRILTMDEAPSTTRAQLRITVPTWAYGAATSVAVALFALVLSADLGGLLAQEVTVPAGPRQNLEAPASAAPEKVEPAPPALQQPAEIASTLTPSLQTDATTTEAAAAAAAAPAPLPEVSPDAVQPAADDGAREIAALPPAAATEPDLEKPEQAADPTPQASAGDTADAPRNEATASVWRVLEVVLGGLALLFVGSVLWHMRHLWSRNTS